MRCIQEEMMPGGVSEDAEETSRGENRLGTALAESGSGREERWNGL